MMKKPIAIFILIAFCARAQAAEDSGFYAGTSLGASKFSNRSELCDGPSYIFGPLNPQLFGRTEGVARRNESDDCEERKLGWKIFGGYSFGGFFALEGGFAQLGQVESNLSFSRSIACARFTDARIRCSLDEYQSNLTYDHSGSFFAFALARYPFTERFSVFGKLGAHAYEIDVDGNVQEVRCTLRLAAPGDCPQLPLTDDFDEDGVEIAYGFGMEYRFNSIGVRAEWERFEFDGRFFSASADFYSAAIVYHF